MPAQPTKPHIIQNGCHEKYLHSPLGCVPAMYPTIILNKKKHVTNNWYTESVYAYNVCIVGWGSLGRMECKYTNRHMWVFFFQRVHSSTPQQQWHNWRDILRVHPNPNLSNINIRLARTGAAIFCVYFGCFVSRSTSSEVTFTLLVWKIRRGRFFFVNNNNDDDNNALTSLSQKVLVGLPFWQIEMPIFQFFTVGWSFY